MSEILGNFYCFFSSFFGNNLADYLWGYNCGSEDFSNSIIFNQIGLMTGGISFLFVMTYYYIINSPKFNRWWSWAIMMLLNSLLALFSGYYWVYSDLKSGNIGNCLMFTQSSEGEAMDSSILNSDCWGFGIANFIIAFVFFTIFSLLLNWKSRNCRYSPLIEFTK